MAISQSLVSLHRTLCCRTRPADGRPGLQICNDPEQSFIWCSDNDNQLTPETLNAPRRRWNWRCHRRFTSVAEQSDKVMERDCAADIDCGCGCTAQSLVPTKIPPSDTTALRRLVDKTQTGSADATRQRVLNPVGASFASRPSAKTCGRTVSSESIGCQCHK